MKTRKAVQWFDRHRSYEQSEAFIQVPVIYINEEWYLGKYWKW